MRMNFFAFLFLVFLIIPFVIISCTRSLTTLMSPNRFKPTVPTSFASPAVSSTTIPAASPATSLMTNPTTSQFDRCTEGCCICGEKPVGHLFVLHDRSYRLCRRHLSEVPKLIDSALRRIPNTFVTLTLHDLDTIVAVVEAIK
jgi:hypothetical protein